MLILILLLITATTLAEDLSCVNHFPTRESAEILKKLVSKYAIQVRRTDSNGFEWLNNVIVKNDGLEVDDVRYYLNDNRLPPEMTFYFTDSLMLNPVPIFVVKKEQLNNWRPDFPDRIYALTKISHRCAVGQRACGLKCCYEERDIVQKGFLESSNSGKISPTATYTLNDVTYSLQLLDNSSAPGCKYYLSYYDKLFGKRMIDGKQVSTIYFSCPPSFTCCGMKCLPPPATALLRRARETNLLSFQLDRHRSNALLIVGAGVSLIAFIGITFHNHRNPTVIASRKSMTNRYRREMVDMQTSTTSLHDDETRTPIVDVVHIS